MKSFLASLPSQRKKKRSRRSSSSQDISEDRSKRPHLADDSACPVLSTTAAAAAFVEVVPNNNDPVDRVIPTIESCGGDNDRSSRSATSNEVLTEADMTRVMRLRQEKEDGNVELGEDRWKGLGLQVQKFAEEQYRTSVELEMTELKEQLHDTAQALQETRVQLVNAQHKYAYMKGKFSKWQTRIETWFQQRNSAVANAAASGILLRPASPPPPLPTTPPSPTTTSHIALNESQNIPPIPSQSSSTRRKGQFPPETILIPSIVRIKKEEEIVESGPLIDPHYHDPTTTLHGGTNEKTDSPNRACANNPSLGTQYLELPLDNESSDSMQENETEEPIMKNEENDASDHDSFEKTNLNDTVAPPTQPQVEGPSGTRKWRDNFVAMKTNFLTTSPMKGSTKQMNSETKFPQNLNPNSRNKNTKDAEIQNPTRKQRNALKDRTNNDDLDRMYHATNRATSVKQEPSLYHKKSTLSTSKIKNDHDNASRQVNENPSSDDVVMMCQSTNVPPKQQLLPKGKDGGFKYHEVVRNRDKRRAMPGHCCDECTAFVNVVCRDGAFDRDAMIRECSRHRSNHTPPMTPDGFWELSFADEITARRTNDNKKNPR